MTNSSFRNGVQFAWDATSITEAMTCGRKYYYGMVLGIKPKISSVHLVFGKHYADAMEHFYKHRADGLSYDEATREVVREALTNTWNTKEHRPIEFAHSAKTRTGLIRSIVWYLETYAKDEKLVKTHHLRSGTPAVEVSFSLDVGDDLLLCGHLDRIVQYSDDLYVMDQKTTGSALGSYYFDQYKPDNQMTLYTWAGQAILESPVKGVIIDAAQINVGGTSFARGFTLRSERELEEWFESVLELIRRTQNYSYNAELAKETGEAAAAFPMNLTACGNYGGCPFRSICSASPHIREKVIKSEYTSRKWDPLERR